MLYEIVVTLALLLVIEGILPFLSPDKLRKVLMLMLQMDDRQLRFSGLTSMLVGVLLLYFMH